jgi:two-component system, NtrC family, nitrogen regulation response regulator NtrX
MSTGNILVVDDEPDIRQIVQEILEDEDYEITTAENAAAARAAYSARRPDLVLLDIWMPDTDGITLLKEWSRDHVLPVPVVMMSGHGTVETAVEAIRLGAYDFIEKPLTTAKLLVTITRALQNARLRQENLSLKRHTDRVSVPVGKSKAMKQLRATIERIAAHDTWTLITGEPGSGKEVAARYLHSRSLRKDRAFVEINLAAVPAQSLAVRLFGSETGGDMTPGVFEQAAGGTLFLEQIGDLDLATQSRLLNVLEEKRFLRGGNKSPVSLDVRVIAATSQNLVRAIAEGRFREDLYYRLNVVPLTIPSLREHHEDVPELVSFYVDWMVERERLPYRRFTTGALNVLRNHTWPGNIRELKNLVQRLLILSQSEEVTEADVAAAFGVQKATVTAKAIPATVNEAPFTDGGSAEREAISEGGFIHWTNAGAGFLPALFGLPLREARDHFEKAYLEHHLKLTDGNVGDIAAAVGMERTHLYRKLKGLGIDLKKASLHKDRPIKGAKES